MNWAVLNWTVCSKQNANSSLLFLQFLINYLVITEFCYLAYIENVLQFLFFPQAGRQLSNHLCFRISRIRERTSGSEAAAWKEWEPEEGRSYKVTPQMLQSARVEQLCYVCLKPREKLNTVAAQRSSLCGFDGKIETEMSHPHAETLLTKDNCVVPKLLLGFILPFLISCTDSPPRRGQTLQSDVA